MGRLMSEQQELAAQHARLVSWVAYRRRRDRRRWDENVSAAALALCRGAEYWTGAGAALSTYAVVTMERQVARDRQRRHRKEIQRLTYDPINPRDRFAALEARDEAAPILARFDRLTLRQRQVPELYMSGVKWHEIAAQLGIARTNVEALRCRAPKRFRGLNA
jgi:RNA polymerase sigma factor (sigma-70 family)